PPLTCPYQLAIISYGPPLEQRVERAATRLEDRGRFGVGWVERHPHERSRPLEPEAQRGNHDRPRGAPGAARAPAGCRRSTPPSVRQHHDATCVFREGEP